MFLYDSIFLFEYLMEGNLILKLILNIEMIKGYY